MEYGSPGPLRQLVLTETLTIGTVGVNVKVNVGVSDGVKVNWGVLVGMAARLAATALASAVCAASVEATTSATCVFKGTAVAWVVPPVPTGRLQADVIMSKIKTALVKNLFLYIGSPCLGGRISTILIIPIPAAKNNPLLRGQSRGLLIKACLFHCSWIRANWLVAR